MNSNEMKNESATTSSGQPARATRSAINVTLSTTVPKTIKLMQHNHLMVISLDDTILMSNSNIIDPANMQAFVDTGDSVTLDDDTQEEITLMAQAVAGARVRLITW